MAYARAHPYNQVAVGKRVRARRQLLGLSQRGLQQPGLTAAYISRIEKGERLPSMHALAALAAKLDTTALYLLTGDDTVPCPLCGRHEHGGRSNGKNGITTVRLRRVRA